MLNKQEIQEPKTHIVFTFCGGGVRGFAESKIYHALEQKVLEKVSAISKIPSFSKISDAITCLGGTSIGAFFAINLAVNNSSSSELLKLSEQFGNKVFSPHENYFGGAAYPRYERVGLDKVVYDSFHDKTLNHLNKLLIVPSFSLDRGEPTIWSNCINQNSYIKTVSSGTLMDIMEATSAAPIYFEAAKVIYDDKEYREIDGGMFANNPTSITLDILEKHSDNTQLQNLVVISIGAGTVSTKLGGKSLKEIAYGGIADYLDDDYFLKVIFSAVDQVISFTAHNKVDHYNGKYFHFQPTIPNSLYELSNDKKDYIDRLNNFIDSYINSADTQHELNDAADAIIAAHIYNISA